MPKEWNDDDVKAEIADAVRIVREDKFEAFVRGKLPASSNDPNGGTGQSGNPGSGNPNDSGTTKKGKSLWWGDSE
jgi:hypothetical protein